MSEINKVLADIQRRLHVPKDKKNDFGGYNYRNAEGILAAFKALGIEGASLVCRDDVQEVAGQIFVTATAELSFGGETISATGHAMHPLQKKGMDASQITGSASSYARKYALGGLLAIEDESADPDAQDNRNERGQTPPPVKKVSPEEAEVLADMATRGSADRAKLFEYYQIDGETWADVPEAQFVAVRNGLQAKLDRMDAEHDAATKGE